MAFNNNLFEIYEIKANKTSFLFLFLELRLFSLLSKLLGCNLEIFVCVAVSAAADSNLNRNCLGGKVF